MSERLRILLVDDHTLFRESMARLLNSQPDLDVVADCATVSEASAILSRVAVDLILLDYDLGEEAGTTLLNKLPGRVSRPRVVLLTAGLMPTVALRSRDDGAAGIVLKHSSTAELLQAIRQVCAGGEWWDRSLLQTPAESAAENRKTRELTPRQRIVLRGILDGLSNKEIAARLDVSETSVKASVQELFAKAGVRTRSQLVRIAIERFSLEWLRE